MSAEALATLLAQPAIPAPPGVTANFDNPPKSNTIAWVVNDLRSGDHHNKSVLTVVCSSVAGEKKVRGRGAPIVVLHMLPMQ
ncbi:hypothetical protein N7486_006789 [Penicillium sp. IBT 16267x]|nr:hypothetical protein N7486_006789 [Penicillium sp. IBT 16267x]